MQEPLLVWRACGAVHTLGQGRVSATCKQIRQACSTQQLCRGQAGPPEEVCVGHRQFENEQTFQNMMRTGFPAEYRTHHKALEEHVCLSNDSVLDFYALRRWACASTMVSKPTTSFVPARPSQIRCSKDAQNMVHKILPSLCLP